MISDSGAFSSLALPVPTSVGLFTPSGSPSPQRDLAGINPLQAVVLQAHFVAELHSSVSRSSGRCGRESVRSCRASPSWVAVGNDLAEESIDLHVAASASHGIAALRLVLHSLEAVHRRLQVPLHMCVIGGILFLRRPVEDLCEGLDLAPEVNLRCIEFVF